MTDFLQNVFSDLLAGWISLGLVALLALLAHRLWQYAPPRSDEKDLNGLWLTQFRTQFGDQSIIKTQIIEVRHYRNRLRAAYLAGDSMPFRVDGRFRFHTYITGTWDNLDKNDEIHGSFTLVMLRASRGKLFRGRWIGIERGLDVASGDFKWFFLGKQKRKEASVKALEYCRDHEIPETWTGESNSTEFWPDEARQYEMGEQDRGANALPRGAHD